ncbi:hypothetical protein [Polluticoccus soli]|uniref:hypothetical protein n=1 Tax=Polluticoccus soli TaxID=3034150 RepID=UPI0023E181AD|nr:hypothetical protein [Flavipsychrobacter sp. JY13-12]
MNFINKWKDKIAHYVDVRIQLVKLNVIERSSNVLSYLIFVFICLFLSLSVLIFLGIVIGELFSGIFDSRPLGYLVTTGIYILLVALMFGLRKSIINTFAGVFIRILTSVDEDDTDEEEQDATKAA